MTTAVLISNASLDAERSLEFRPNNPGAQGYEIPWSTLLPGLSACVIVDGSTQLEVREGGQVPEGYTPPRPEVLEVTQRDGATEVTIGDNEIITINGIRFQGVAFTFLADDASVGKVFRLDSNTDGVVQVTELLQVPDETVGQAAIGGVVVEPDPSPGAGDTLPGAAMLSETHEAGARSLTGPDLTIHNDADPVGLA